MKIVNFPEFKAQVQLACEKASGLKSLLEMYERDDAAAPAIREAMLVVLDVLRLRVADAVKAARGEEAA
jgi:hypothetical protein